MFASVGNIYKVYYHLHYYNNRQVSDNERRYTNLS